METEIQNSSQKNITSKIIEIISGYKSLLVSSLITLLSGFFFLNINNLKLVTATSFSQRSVGISVVAIIFLITFLATYYSKLTTFQKVSVWLQSNLLVFFSFAYFIGINAVTLSFLGITLNTAFAGILFTLLIFMVNLNLFGANERRMYLVVPQIILFSLQTYSFINLLQTDKTALRDFTTDWISTIFSVNNVVWLVFCAIAISLISVLSYKLESIKKNLIFISIFSLLNLQVLFAFDNVTGLSYWYKALLFLIYWDFIYNPLILIVNEINDKSFNPKLTISTVYHIILVVVVLLGKPIFG